MARIIVLDSKPLSEAAGPAGRPLPEGCRTWLALLVDSGATIVVPEIADYEARRKYLHRDATASITRLDALKAKHRYAPLTTAIMLRAAELWADVRKAGRPTAGPGALDADCIVAAQALAAGGPGDVVIVATSNERHLERFPGIDAREWHTIF